MRIIVNLLLIIVSLSANSQTSPIFDIETLESAQLIAEKNINTDGIEFSPTYYGENIAFVYLDRDHKDRDPEINEPYFDIGYASIDQDGFLSEKIPFSSIFNTKLHEGPLSYDQEQQKLYFSRVDILKSESTRKKKARQQIYEFDFETQAAFPVSFNTPDADFCHPTINTSGNLMIFSSDLDGNGDMNLYSTTYNNGIWTNPVKLSDHICTLDNEFFPYLYNDSLLLFSSDREGLGGYDLYASSLVDGIWSTPIMLPYPFNSPYDDFGMIIDFDGKNGYLSSNRPGGMGKDDIYKWQTLSSIFYDEGKNMSSATFNIKEKLTFKQVKGASISILKMNVEDELNRLAEQYNIELTPTTRLELIQSLKMAGRTPDQSTYSNDAGSADLVFDKSKKHLVEITKSGFAPYTFLLSPETNMSSIDILLEPLEENVPKPTSKIYIPTKKGEVAIFNNIYYDFNSSKIQSGATPELDALSTTMLTNKTMKIRLSAHTDARGPSGYNLQLSEKRALSAKKYLTSKGVSPERIQTIGLGETQIRNQCKEGVECTEEQHQFNRRTTVEVIEN